MRQPLKQNHVVTGSRPLERVKNLAFTFARALAPQAGAPQRAKAGQQVKKRQSFASTFADD
jgi:hypothetical protein